MTSTNTTDTTRLALLALTAAADDALAALRGPLDQFGPDVLPRLETALRAGLEVLHPTPGPPPDRVAVPANVLALVGSFVGKFNAVTYHPDDPHADAIAYAAHELGLHPLPSPGAQFRSVRGAHAPASMLPTPAGPRPARPGDQVVDAGKAGRLYACLACGGIGLLFVPDGGLDLTPDPTPGPDAGVLDCGQPDCEHAPGGVNHPAVG